MEPGRLVSNLAVSGAGMEDAHVHDGGRAAECAEREPAPVVLPHSGQVGHDAQQSLPPTHGQARRLHLVEHEDGADTRCEVAQVLQECGVAGDLGVS